MSGAARGMGLAAWGTRPQRLGLLAAARSMHSGSLKGNAVIGVRRETKNRWERRAPITPKHVRTLRRNEIQVYVQPSSMRVFTNQQYEAAGAIISEDLTPASLIIGVKEVPIPDIIPDRTYMCFSHTIKAQPGNMAMMDAFLEKNVRLIDYETMVDKDTGKRVIGFGKFAGNAGMIDLLRALGDRLLGLGYSTPFLGMGYSDYYHSLWGAKTSLHVVGQNIQIQGLPRAHAPFIFGFTGKGNVTDGALEIFRELPHEFVSVADLPYVISSGDTRTLYGVLLDRQDLVERVDGQPFDKANYNENPHLYRNIFHERVAPYISALVHGMYWEDRFPRLLTFDETTDLYKAGKNSRLLAIADISADPHGSIEFTTFCTTIDRPYCVYNPRSRQHVFDWEAEGILLGSVDNLPAEFPAEASTHFGDLLLPYLPDLARSNGEVPFGEQKDRATVHNAVILSNGKLTPNFEYIAEKRSEFEGGRKRVLVIGSGMVAGPAVKHLAESGNIDVTIGTDNVEGAKDLVAGLAGDGVSIRELDVGDQAALADAVSRSDVVISLVPAPLHPLVAEACIENKVHLVTSSYVSPEMEALDQRAQDAGVVLLNEMGLDPGIDHLMAMKAVDEAHAQGDKVLSFVSWCGGLPSPEASGNPLGYKCSWSVKAFLSAGRNDATFLKGGQPTTIPGNELFASAEPVSVLPGYSLEGYPNRDSLKYQELYGLKDAKTVLRGTLRYKGFCEIMDVLARIELLDDHATVADAGTTWRGYLAGRLGCPEADVEAAIRDKCTSSGVQPTATSRAIAAMTRFGLLSDAAIGDSSLREGLAQRLAKQLAFKDGERDLVLLQHTLDIERAGGNIDEMHLTLIQSGEVDGSSAMATTVGLSAAFGAQLVLQGDCSAGVLRPLTRDIYEPILGMLADQGLHYTCEVFPKQAQPAPANSS